MSLLLLLAGLAVRLVLALVILTVAAGTVWVVWDCTAGPSARLAAAARREGVGGA